MIKLDAFSEIVKSAWLAFAPELNLVQIPDFKFDEQTIQKNDSMMSSIVQISGDWQGFIFMSCHFSMVQKIGADLYQKEVVSFERELMEDMFLEISNLICGHFISSSEVRELSMSLPKLASKKSVNSAFRKGNVIFPVCYYSGDERLVVYLLKSET